MNFKILHANLGIGWHCLCPILHLTIQETFSSNCFCKLQMWIMIYHFFHINLESNCINSYPMLQDLEVIHQLIFLKTWKILLIQTFYFFLVCFFSFPSLKTHYWKHLAYQKGHMWFQNFVEQPKMGKIIFFKKIKVNMYYYGLPVSSYLRILTFISL